MLIAIAGSQGSGKTTILNRLMEIEPEYKIVERKTSRSILSDWNITLEQVNSDPDLTVKFQDEILSRKIVDDASHQAGEIVFTERTVADLFTYAVVSLGKHNRYSDWLDEYYQRCCAAQQLYTHVFYLKAGQFSVEFDGVRGVNQHYSRMVDLTMFDLTTQMTPSSSLTVIDTPILDQRVQTIHHQTRRLFQHQPAYL